MVNRGWLIRLRDEAGATAIEYALLGSLIAVVILASVTSVGREVGGMFATVAGAFQPVATPGGSDGTGDNGNHYGHDK